MRKVHFLALLTAGVAVVGLLTGEKSALKAQMVAVPPMTEFERTGTTMDGWDWASAPWTEDDAPYQAIVNKIEHDLHHGKTAHAIVTDYQEKEQFHSQDPLTVFAWGAAKWRSRCWAPSNVASDPDISMLPDELANVSPQPHTYNYVRLRFIVQAEESPMPELQAVGERLLARDPKDRDVQWEQIKVLRRTLGLAENAQAVRLSEKLITENPKEPLYRQMLANCLWDRYRSFGHKKADAEAAIAAYQSYQDHASPGDRDLSGAITALRQDETIDWTPVRSMPATPKAVVPPRIYENARPPLHQKDSALPTGPGEPMPSAPRSDQ